MSVKTFKMTAAERAEIIAGFRAFAQFLEDRPEIPCPQQVNDQHSFMEPLDLDTVEYVPVPDSEKIAFVRGVADLLGVTPDTGEGYATARYAVAPRTTYTVHARLRGEQ